VFATPLLLGGFWAGFFSGRKGKGRRAMCKFENGGNLPNVKNIYYTGLGSLIEQTLGAPLNLLSAYHLFHINNKKLSIF
jgi:hypothetical protein